MPQFLRKQALAPSAHASVETPTLFRYRPLNTQDVIEWEISYASVANLLSYSSCSHYFERMRIRKTSLEWFEFQPMLKATGQVRSHWETTLTALGIAANKARFNESLRLTKQANAHRKMMRESIVDSRRYHVKALDQKALVSCPLTGIVHECSFPSIPVFLEQNHPLAYLKNTQATLEWFLVTSENPDRLQELDTPVLCGLLLVLLRAKHLLSEEGTSALAENASLQIIPKVLLCSYLKTLHQGWEQNKVWQAMPHLSLCAEGISTPATLDAWFKKASLHLLGKPTFDSNTQAKLFRATRPKTIAQRSLKIYSAETGQYRKLKDNKETAYTLFKELADHMSPVLKTLVRTTISDLILITVENKETVVSALGKAFLSTPWEDKAKQLASIISTTETNRIALELGRVSDDFNLPKRSIAEILAEKAEKGKGN